MAKEIEFRVRIRLRDDDPRTLDQMEDDMTFHEAALDVFLAGRFDTHPANIVIDEVAVREFEN